MTCFDQGIGVFVGVGVMVVVDVCVIVGVWVDVDVLVDVFVLVGVGVDVELGLIVRVGEAVVLARRRTFFSHADVYNPSNIPVMKINLNGSMNRLACILTQLYSRCKLRVYG